jgi:hypothetical protein
MAGDRISPWLPPASNRADKMATQTAVIINKHGEPSVLEVVKDHPMPARSAGQVLVKNVSSSINPVDYKIRQGPVAHTAAWCSCCCRCCTHHLFTQPPDPARHCHSPSRSGAYPAEKFPKVGSAVRQLVLVQ